MRAASPSPTFAHSWYVRVGVERRELVAHQVAGAVGQHHDLGAAVALHGVERGSRARRLDPRAAIACCSIGSACISAARSSMRSCWRTTCTPSTTASTMAAAASSATTRRPRTRPRAVGGLRASAVDECAAAAPRGPAPARRAHPRCPAHSDAGAAHVARGQERHRLAQRLHLGARVVVAVDVARDLLALLAVERVEREQRQELVELGAGQLSVHDDVIPDSTSVSRRRRNPTRIRLLTVPSGWSSSTATSR